MVNKIIANLQLIIWTVVVVAISLLIATPILFIFSSIFSYSQELWIHLINTVLGEYLLNSLWLMMGVGAGVLVVGISTAWLVTMCGFPLRGLWEWMLLLPLASPAYLIGYAYTNMMDFFGPVQVTLRSWFGWESVQDYWFPNIRSLWGVILMFILVLYPYVYLLARVAFIEQSLSTLEASRSLGYSSWGSFFKVALPLARPSIIAGLSLALMETLNDFGTVQYFGVNTFTTGIYNTWFGGGDRSGAAQLSAFLMIFILTLIILEAYSRSQARYYQTSNSYKSVPPYQLNWWRCVLAWLVCSIPILFGFLIPCVYLVTLTLQNWEANLEDSFWTLSHNSFILALLSAGIGVVLSLIMAYGRRIQYSWGIRIAVRISAMGYAIPGTVIAVGVLIPLGNFDNFVDNWMRTNWGISTGLLLSGTIAALIFAYIVRFLAVAYSSVESSLGKIKPTLDDAARSLGYNPTVIFFKVHLPLIWGGILTAIMFLFVDVMKELPATLVMRPFNFDTLAVRVYQYASDERLAEAAAPALAIILVGIIPVIFLSWRIAHSRSVN